VRKERVSEGAYREEGRLEVLRKDSLWEERLAQVWVGRKMEVLHLELMEPDSAARQFVRSVTVVRSAEEGRGRVSSSLLSGAEVSALAETGAEAWQEERSLVKTKRGALFWGVWAAVALAGVWVLNPRRSHRRSHPPAP
jgi:hypothetical protein